jgi:hypothetical protein
MDQSCRSQSSGANGRLKKNRFSRLALLIADIRNKIGTKLR